MNIKEQIKLIKKSVNSDMNKISRLIKKIAKEDNDTDELLLLLKLLYDTRRNVENKIHQYEKRMC
ncbi:MAG: hypothetical protein KHX03_03550 [Clostridium sp.]|nr:hypothetical protein [Clostridium sp.]